MESLAGASQRAAVAVRAAGRGDIEYAATMCGSALRGVLAPLGPPCGGRGNGKVRLGVEDTVGPFLQPVWDVRRPFQNARLVYSLGVP